jgi:hypothetical protein
MKIKIRHHDASVPQEDGWPQMGDWLAELGSDDHAEPSGDGRTEPQSTDDFWLAARAEADARAQAAARAQSDAHAEAPEEAATTPTAVMAAGPGLEPDQVAMTPDPASAEPPMATQRNWTRPLEVARCSMCGITLPLALMVPDGGQACANIRWYCKDAMSCTHRWTTAQMSASAQTPAASDDATAGAGEAAPFEAPAERPGYIVEAAPSAG